MTFCDCSSNYEKPNRPKDAYPPLCPTKNIACGEIQIPISHPQHKTTEITPLGPDLVVNIPGGGHHNTLFKKVRDDGYEVKPFFDSCMFN